MVKEYDPRMAAAIVFVSHGKFEVGLSFGRHPVYFTVSMVTQTDVLIAGAGPVGLLLAAELSRDGVKVLLVDPMLSRSFFCKALGITPRTLEIFADLGFVHDAISRGLWLEGVSAFDDGTPAGSMDLPENLPFGSLSLAQFETERLLESCLHRHGGSVDYGWALTHFSQSPDGITATLTGPAGESKTVHSRWLVGCDGAHSRVRSLLGLPFEGGRYPQTFALADLEVDWDLPRGRMHRFNTGTPGQPGAQVLAAVPIHDPQGRRYRLSTVIPDTAQGSPIGDDGEPAAPDLQQVISLMSPLLPTGAKLSDLHWSSVYRVSHRIVSEYSKGRVFLAGDAAHLHPPVGGQGMNTGLQDAHNLAWKLTLASRDLARPDLLDSYSSERRPVGLDVVQNTSLALNNVLAQKSPLPGMRETQLLVTYRGSRIVCDDGVSSADQPLASGDRMPNAGGLRRRFVDQPFQLHEILGKGRHVLLGFLNPDDQRSLDTHAELSRLLTKALGDLAVSFVIIPQGANSPKREDLAFLEDSTGDFLNVFGASSGRTWLVRPDGHIGWYSDSPSIDGLASSLRLITQG